jgi:hypothetical protein
LAIWMTSIFSRKVAHWNYLITFLQSSPSTGNGGLYPPATLLFVPSRSTANCKPEDSFQRLVEQKLLPALFFLVLKSYQGIVYCLTRSLFVQSPPHTDRIHPLLQIIVFCIFLLAYFPIMKVGLSHHQSVCVRVSPTNKLATLGRSSWYLVGRWCQSRGPRCNIFLIP